MKLIAALLLCAAAGSGVLFSLIVAHRPARGAFISTFQSCQSGAVELIDERCDLTACGRQSIRLEWDGEAGVLSEDGVEHRRIGAPLLSRLLTDLSTLQPISTDAERVCADFGCPFLERARTITTECSGLTETFTFMSARPAWDRVRSQCAGLEGPELAKCTAQRAWHAAFATQLAARFSGVFLQLRETARGG